MISFDLASNSVIGSAGSLLVPNDDEITRKLMMLIEGECGGSGAAAAAAKFDFSKQRYFQLRTAYLDKGAVALLSQKRGPKTNYRRTGEVVRQVIRHRFLDPEVSPEVVAQMLCQSGLEISIRSVQRIIESFGLQKKTLQLSSRS